MIQRSVEARSIHYKAGLIQELWGGGAELSKMSNDFTKEPHPAEPSKSHPCLVYVVVYDKAS